MNTEYLHQTLLNIYSKSIIKPEDLVTNFYKDFSYYSWNQQTLEDIIEASFSNSFVLNDVRFVELVNRYGVSYE